MNPGIQSLWIILTVIVPGLVFYGTFRILTGVLGVNLPFLAKIDQAGDAVSISILFAVMFTLQFFGITAESLAFKYGPYKHKNGKYQNAFNKRYEIIATMDPEKDYHVERILGQFFMSHNIAVGMIINLLWTVIYLFIIVKRFDSTAVVTALILLIITVLSVYIPYNRFYQSCKALYAHLHKVDS